MLRLVCSWCKCVMREGDEPSQPTSHGICARCAAEVFGTDKEETPSTILEKEVTMRFINTKVFFGRAEDNTLTVVGAENEKLHYAGDYYVNEFYRLPDQFNPVGLTLGQLNNYVTAWGLQSGRTLETDLQEDR